MARPSLWLCDDCVAVEDGPYYVGYAGVDGICARCGGLASSVYYALCELPRRASHTEGVPEAFTTAVTIEPFPSVAWDTNRYYADLGVTPRATRLEIRRAYEAKNGQEDERLTHIVKQLLAPGVRARYDATPLGHVFYDRYIAESVRIQNARMVSEAHASGAPDDWFVPLDISQYINERSFAVVDTSEMGGHHERPRLAWNWGYWLWRTGCRDTQRLAEWQELLVRVLSGDKEVHSLVIGFVGHSDAPFEVVAVGHRLIVFLGDKEQPSVDLAIEAAGRVVQHLQPGGF